MLAVRGFGGETGGETGFRIEVRLQWVTDGYGIDRCTLNLRWLLFSAS